MSERIAKVESLIQQIVAEGLNELLDSRSAYVTVTGVDASPDLRTAVVWIGLLGDRPEDFEAIQAERPALQKRVAAKLTTKFVPKLELRLDSGGQYADHINRLLRQP